MVMLNGSRERREATQHPKTNTVKISLAWSADTTLGVRGSENNGCCCRIHNHEAHVPECDGGNDRPH